AEQADRGHAPGLDHELLVQALAQTLLALLHLERRLGEIDARMALRIALGGMLLASGLGHRTGDDERHADRGGEKEVGLIHLRVLPFEGGSGSACDPWSAALLITVCNRANEE